MIEQIDLAAQTWAGRQVALREAQHTLSADMIALCRRWLDTRMGIVRNEDGTVKEQKQVDAPDWKVSDFVLFTKVAFALDEGAVRLPQKRNDGEEPPASLSLPRDLSEASDEELAGYLRRSKRDGDSDQSKA